MKNRKITSTPILCTLACAALLVPNAFGVNPPPDGCYPNFTTAEGCNALQSLTTGAANTALGWYSLWSNTDGSYNTAVGAGTLVFNVGNQSTGEGTQNTAVGAAALLLNSAGRRNTAVGALALQNSTGDSNTANGASALQSNTTGFGNTANGTNALFNNSTGDVNTALGAGAGLNGTTGFGNVYIGADMLGVAGESNTTYIRNVNTTEQSASGDVAYVTVRLSDGRIGHQPIIMRSAGSELQKTAEELKSTVTRHEATIAQLRKAMEVLTAQLKEQAALVQKVSAQVEVSKSAQQTVVNNL